MRTMPYQSYTKKSHRQNNEDLNKTTARTMDDDDDDDYIEITSSVPTIAFVFRKSTHLTHKQIMAFFSVFQLTFLVN